MRLCSSSTSIIEDRDPSAHLNILTIRVKNRDRLCVTPLDKLQEPDSLVLLRERVNALIPQVDVPDALLEIHGLTGLADEFTHIRDTQAEVENLSLSVCAVLLAQACNTTFEPVVQNDVPALTYARLVWVQQNHIRAETIARANARLVKAQSQIPLTKVWGYESDSQGTGGDGRE